MLSRTILICLCVLWCSGEKSVHGRPSWELAPYDCGSQNTEDFAAWCKLVSKECRFNDRAGECKVVRFTTQFFILDKAKAQHDLHDNGRNTIKGGSQETKGQKGTGGRRTGYGKQEIVTHLSPRHPPPPKKKLPDQSLVTKWFQGKWSHLLFHFWIKEVGYNTGRG